MCVSNLLLFRPFFCCKLSIWMVALVCFAYVLCFISVIYLLMCACSVQCCHKNKAEIITHKFCLITLSCPNWLTSKFTILKQWWPFIPSNLWVAHAARAKKRDISRSTYTALHALWNCSEKKKLSHVVWRAEGAGLGRVNSTVLWRSHLKTSPQL